MLLKTMPPWLPYVAPFILFILLTGIDSQERFLDHYPWLYALKIVIVTTALIALRRYFPEARPGGNGLAVATLAGVILTFVWIFGNEHTPHIAFLEKMLGKRVGYDPYREIENNTARNVFLAVRFFGLVVVVPFVEELFYRGFLLRLVTDPDDFRRVPVGVFSLAALGVNVLLMTVSHPEWLVAGLFSAAMCGLLAGTKNLFACILAHATTNLMLGIYVLHTHDWSYW